MSMKNTLKVHLYPWNCFLFYFFHLLFQHSEHLVTEAHLGVIQKNSFVIVVRLFHIFFPGHATGCSCALSQVEREHSYDQVLIYQ